MKITVLQLNNVIEDHAKCMLPLGVNILYGCSHHPSYSLIKLCIHFYDSEQPMNLYNETWSHLIYIQIVSSDYNSQIIIWSCVSHSEAVSSCGVFLGQSESVPFKALVGSSITHNDFHEITSQRKSPPPTSVYLSLSIPPYPPLLLFKPCVGWQQGQRDFLTSLSAAVAQTGNSEPGLCFITAEMLWRENESWFLVTVTIYRVKQCYDEGDVHMEALSLTGCAWCTLGNKRSSRWRFLSCAHWVNCLLWSLTWSEITVI